MAISSVCEYKVRVTMYRETMTPTVSLAVLTSWGKRSATWSQSC